MSSSDQEILHIFKEKEKEIDEKYGGLRIKDLSDDNLNDLEEKYSQNQNALDLIRYAKENKNQWRKHKLETFIEFPHFSFFFRHTLPKATPPSEEAIQKTMKELGEMSPLVKVNRPAIAAMLLGGGTTGMNIYDKVTKEQRKKRKREKNQENNITNNTTCNCECENTLKQICEYLKHLRKYLDAASDLIDQ